MAGAVLELERFEVDEVGVQRMLRSSQAMAHWNLVGDEVARTAQQHCPVLTGRLRASIHHEVTTDREGVLIRVGSEVEYAHYQEMHNRTHKGFLRGALARVGPHTIEGGL